jgi:uncharacterized protein YcfL
MAQENYFQKLVVCPYGFHLVFVAHQDSHLETCSLRRAFLAARSEAQLEAEMEVCRFDSSHVVHGIEMELHEMKCAEEHKRKLEKKKQQEDYIAVLVHTFFHDDNGVEEGREASEEESRPGSGNSDAAGAGAGDGADGTHMIFDIDM